MSWYYLLDLPVYQYRDKLRVQLDSAASVLGIVESGTLRGATSVGVTAKPVAEKKGLKSFLTSKDDLSDANKRINLSDITGVGSTVLKALSGDISKTHRLHLFNKIIAFRGVKGGVGVSSLVANVGYMLARQGLSVCIVDTAICYPSQTYLFNVQYPAKQEDMLFIAESDSVEKILLPVPGLDIKLVGAKNRTILHCISSADKGSVMNVILQWTAKNFDVVLLDICTEFTCISTAALIQSHRVFQVWTPALLSAVNVNRMLHNSQLLAVPTDKMSEVVLNMDCRLSVDYAALLKKHSLHLLTKLPFSTEFFECGVGRLFAAQATTDKVSLSVHHGLGRIVKSILADGDAID